MKIHALALALVATLGLAQVAPAAVVTSGAASFDTGTPTPTLSITAPLIFTITRSGTVSDLVFDEWVTNDGNQTYVDTISIQTLSYSLDGNSGTVSVNRLFDNLSRTQSTITPNDGYIFVDDINVVAGQTLTILPGTFTFGYDPTFNPGLPTYFSGNVFLVNENGNLLSGLTAAAAPEPSTWMLLGLGASAAILASRRCRRTCALSS